MSKRRKQLILIVPPGRYRELLSALTMPVAVVRLANYVQRQFANVDCHVIEAPVVFGQPINEVGETKVHQMIYDYLDDLIDGEVLIGFSTFANRDVVHSLPLAKGVKARRGGEMSDIPDVVVQFRSRSSPMVKLE